VNTIERLLPVIALCVLWASPILATETKGEDFPSASDRVTAETSSSMNEPDSAVTAGPFTQAQCLECHQKRNPVLVEAWQEGPHGTTADCVACHGERHGKLPAARRDEACTDCHAGPVAHSYATSKHGVLVQIGRPDWTRPLRRGEHRSPGCAYCHLHDTDHGDAMAPERGPMVREWVCSGCHAPRYVAEQFDAGDRLTGIARLKQQEAAMLADRHPGGPAAVKELLDSVSGHLGNVRLGAGHQSPDYQWWHGQPALDGDLIRLRDAVETARRAPGLLSHRGRPASALDD